ncbi:carbohydrate sulfotransferase 1 [Protopterus annectens]|uniref:carbohydrate sulfotransferase 1 n=1 Tax=Protopterus annectens TaxID=7888 RepID=UPI001CFB7DEE|nr:carbohydrate sulfotransferase 1 [Protopterus annectens]XP_043938516.1 carbohydrate sulfotransferase 1 [Protopterus annectens]XP_043938517.1 carbohydrate sulfotransferase 1 [Protopterus annectens]
MSPVMNCSWKIIFLLALALIAIQYKAIRNFSTKPVHTCPTSGPLNCTLMQDMEPQDRACEEYSLFNYNGSRKTHILILATTRSGSSFSGQLFNQHSDIFYLYEPLYHVQVALLPKLILSRNPAERRIMMGANRDLLRSLYDCDLYFLESYLKPQPTNHTTLKLFRRGASKALCTPPVCSAYGPADINIEENTCVKQCGLLNLTLASESCKERGHVAIKTVRVPEVGDLRALVEDPRLNIKVIQLVRDPRGILTSRIETFPDIYRLWRMWRATNRKPYNLDESLLTTICDDFLNSVSLGLSRPPWLKGKYMMVRYEDLARNPRKKTEEIYDFLGMSMDSNVEEWIQNNTRGGASEVRDKFGTVRDSAATAESWRIKISFDIVLYAQRQCEQVLDLLGYRMVNSSDELKNMSFSLVEEKPFPPFL